MNTMVCYTPWQAIADKVQRHRESSLALVEPPVPEPAHPLSQNVTAMPEKLLSPQEIDITTKPMAGLLASLANGELSSTDVTNAYLRRAALAQKLVHT